MWIILIFFVVLGLIAWAVIKDSEDADAARHAALDAEVDAALRLWDSRLQSPEDMKRWQDFRNAMLERRGLFGWTTSDANEKS